MTVWQDLSRSERLTIITELNAAGKSASQIGAQLKTTKNAVLSIAYKAGVTLRDWGRRDNTKAVVARRLAAEERRALREREKAEQDAARKAVFEEQLARDAARAMPAWKPLPGTTPVELWETAPTLGRAGSLCCWPLWATDDEPKMFCGQDIDDQKAPYCSQHMRVAYEPRRKRKGDDGYGT